MNIKLHMLGLATTAALSLGVGPAWAADNYKFEEAGCLSGNTVAVRLIDETTGKPAINAQVFAVHRQWLPGKGAPRFMERKIALTPASDGRFTYESSEVQPSANIKLVAKIDGSDVSGSIDIC